MRVDHRRKRKCPRCDGITMMRHFCSEERGVEVDQCPNCAGFWLDAGELARIRAETRDGAQRRKMLHGYMNKLVEDYLAQARAGAGVQVEVTRKVTRVLRVLSPEA